MNEEGINPALEPHEFEAPALECALLNLTAGEIARRFSLHHAAIFQIEPGFGWRIKTHEVVGPAIDGNVKALEEVQCRPDKFQVR